jgi:hypothetical protein
MLAAFAAIAVVACADRSLAPEEPRPSYIALVDTLTTNSAAGDVRVTVRVLDRHGDGVAGVPMAWRVLSGGGSLVTRVMETDSLGRATATWRLGQRVDEAHLLEAAAADLVPLRIRARSRGQFDTTIDSVPGLVVDTIGALLSHQVYLTLRWTDGSPVIGALVEFAVRDGGGSVGTDQVRSDSTGRAATTWRLGDSLGLQRVVARLPDWSTLAPSILAPGGPSRILSSSDEAMAVVFEAAATPGRPVAFAFPRDLITLDALGASDTIRVDGVDRAGHRYEFMAAGWSALDSTIAVVDSQGVVRATGDGVTQVVASTDGVSDTVEVQIVRTAVRLRFDGLQDTVYQLGDTLTIEGVALDRLGSAISSARLEWRNLTPRRADLVTENQVVPVAPGRIRLEARADAVTDTARFVVIQKIASISALAPSDTLQLDSTFTLRVSARDANGFVIPVPELKISSIDTSIVRPDSGLRVRGVFPGTTTISVSGDGQEIALDVVVEGVGLLVDGVRRRGSGPIGLDARRILVSNGRFQMLWDGTLNCEKGAFVSDVRIGAEWQPATQRCGGDWLYVSSAVETMPTSIDVVELSANLIELRMRFGDHWFEPQKWGFPPTYQRQPHPFSRTIWLQPGAYGYFTRVQLEHVLDYPNVEHEVGFGGLWGPATVRTAEVDIFTDSMPGIFNYNWGYRVDAAEFLLAGDPLARSLVPLGPAPMITPRFDFGYGSVYVYNYGPISSYGAYIYAAPLELAESTRDICRYAYTHAPFALPPFALADLDRCGPSP